MPGNLSKKTLHRIFSILILLVLAISSLGMGSYSVVQAQEETDSTPTAISTQTPTGTPSPPDRALSSPHISDELIVRFSPGIAGRQREGILQGADVQVRREIPALQAFVLRVPPERLEQVLTALLHNPNVEFVEPNYIATAVDGEPSDPRFPEQWGLEAIGAPDAWSVTTGAVDVVIAIVDTGVDLTHSDLDDKIVPGWDFVNDDPEAQDDHGHGTHVAGIAAAESDNGIGVAGVSWGARIMPVKVLDSSASGSYADVAAGIVFAVDNGAQVINLSLGGALPSFTLEAAVEYAYEGGVVVVAAAGNTGAEGLLYPAAYPQVMAVGAVDQNLERANFSSYGPELDLVAPGVDILSTCLGGTYCTMSGTSMAAPYVSGAVTLLFGLGNDLTPEDISMRLTGKALDIGDVGWDISYGDGLLQLFDDSNGGDIIFFNDLQETSPDAQYIVYVTAENLGMRESAIWVANADGTDSKIIATDDYYWVTNPVWSPDSDRVAYLKVIETASSEHDVAIRFEIWTINVDGTNNRLLTDASFLNPALGYGGKTDIVWNESGEIEFDDNTVFPHQRYGVHADTLSLREIDLQRSDGPEIGAQAQPSNVPYFSQCDSRWRDDKLGTCSETICSAGCAVTATAMVFNYFGIDTDPGRLNTWLKLNSGYLSGCLLKWPTASNISSSIMFVSSTGWDWNLLRYELDSGYPVIAEVRLYGGPHFIVITSYSGDTYYINDPANSSNTTLSVYNDVLIGLRIYHGPTDSGGDTPPSGDTTPPSGYFTNPTDGATITSSTVTVSVYATDNIGGSGVKEVRFSAAWDGQWYPIGISSSDSSEYTINWDMCDRDVPNGDVELGMEIWDNAGKVFIWSEHGTNPHITKDYVCTGIEDPILGDKWEVWGWMNKYLAGFDNAHEYWEWPDGWPYIWDDWGSGDPFGWGGDEFSMKFERLVNFPGGDYHFETVSDDGIRVYVDGTKILDKWWDGDGTTGLTRYLSPGDHTVTVEYYENLGDAHIGVWWYGPGYPRPDNDPPDGLITSPTHLSATNDTSLTIAADAWDDASGVNRVEFFVWHCQPTCEWRQLGTDYSAPYSYAWDWSSLQDAHVYLTIHIYDNTDKVRVDPGGYVEVDLDRSVPSVSIDSPVDNTYLTSDLIPIQVTASDTGSGIYAVQFYAGYSDLSGASALEEIERPSPMPDIMGLEAGGLEAGAQEYWHEIGWDTDGSDGWNITWDASAVPDQGGVAFYVYAYDKALNYDGASSWDMVLDRTAPASMVNSLPSTVGTSFTVSWQGSDNTSGIASFDVQYQLNGGAWVNWQEGVAAIEATFIGLLGNTYAFRSRARDMAGNLEDWPSSPDAQTTVSIPPANDNMGEAYIIGALPYSNTQSTGGATLEVDEPTYSCSYNNAVSVWYRYTPGVDGNFTIDTFGSDYDTVLHVFEDPGDGSLPLVGCNDDSDVLQSKVIFGASAGSSYLIGVTHYGGGSGGSLVLNMDEQVCPASALCVVVKDAKGAAAWYPRAVLLDGDGNWIAEGSGGSDGYVVIDPAPSGTYQLVTSAWELFIVDEGVSAPGMFSTTAQGLPNIEIVARDSGGAAIDAKVILAQNPEGYGYVGYTYTSDPLVVYASPGTYDISVIGYADHYLLSLEDQVVSTPGQTIVLDASTMPTDIVTLDWDGFPGGNFSSYAPFTNYWFGINVADGQAVTLSVPEENYRVWTEAVFDDIATGDGWYYRFYHCCFTTGTGGANTTLTVGGTFSATAHSLNANYLPGQTGELSTTVADTYDNNMVIIWHWDEDAAASTLENQIASLSSSGGPAYILDENGQPREVEGASGGLPSKVNLAGTDAGPPSTKFSDTSSSSDISAQGAWKIITPAYQVTDAIGAAISGSLIGSGLYADYEFIIPDPANEGVWEGQATVDFGPYQAPDTGTTNFNVVAFDIPNDDFDNATPIDTMPFSISQEMWAASVAADDPTFPCTSLQHYRSVWFEYTPSVSGTLNIDTDGSDYDTVLAVWTGERGSLSNVACNDDVVLYEITHSSTQLPVWAGTTYYVEVAGYSSFSTGMLNLSAIFDQVTVTKLYLPLIAAQAPGGSSQ